MSAVLYCTLRVGTPIILIIIGVTTTTAVNAGESSGQGANSRRTTESTIVSNTISNSINLFKGWGVEARCLTQVYSRLKRIDWQVGDDYHPPFLASALCVIL